MNATGMPSGEAVAPTTLTTSMPTQCAADAVEELHTIATIQTETLVIQAVTAVPGTKAGAVAATSTLPTSAPTTCVALAEVATMSASTETVQKLLGGSNNN